MQRAGRRNRRTVVTADPSLVMEPGASDWYTYLRPDTKKKQTRMNVATADANTDAIVFCASASDCHQQGKQECEVRAHEWSCRQQPARTTATTLPSAMSSSTLNGKMPAASVVYVCQARRHPRVSVRR